MGYVVKGEVEMVVLLHVNRRQALKLLHVQDVLHRRQLAPAQTALVYLVLPLPNRSPGVNRNALLSSNYHGLVENALFGVTAVPESVGGVQTRLLLLLFLLLVKKDQGALQGVLGSVPEGSVALGNLLLRCLRLQHEGGKLGQNLFSAAIEVFLIVQSNLPWSFFLVLILVFGGKTRFIFQSHQLLRFFVLNSDGERDTLGSFRFVKTLLFLELVLVLVFSLQLVLSYLFEDLVHCVA